MTRIGRECVLFQGLPWTKHMNQQRTVIWQIDKSSKNREKQLLCLNSNVVFDFFHNRENKTFVTVQIVLKIDPRFSSKSGKLVKITEY